jgi:hypothetical protein
VLIGSSGTKQQGCPTIKTTLRDSVISGKFAHYTVKVVAGAQDMDDAIVKVRMSPNRG